MGNSGGRDSDGVDKPHDLVAVDDSLREELAPYIPHLSYLVDDLSATALNQLYARPNNPATLTMQVLLKIVPDNTDLLTELSPLISVFAQLSKDDLTARLAYILSEGNTARDDIQQLYDRIGPIGKEAYMTTAQTMREEFRAEGRVEGEVTGRAKTLLDLLSAKFGPLPPEIVTAVHAADIAQLQTWTVRVLTADSLAEMRIDV